MPVRVCDMCGKEFEAKTNQTSCPECHETKCPVCGKEMVLKGPKWTKYRQQGWVTCGNPKCRAEMTSRSLMEKYGVDNVSKLDSAREKIRQTRLNESEETKAKRSQSLKESCSRPETVAKRKATNKERHGYEAPLQDPEIHDRAVALAHTEEAQEKRKSTLMERYGVENAFCIEGDV